MLRARVSFTVFDKGIPRTLREGDLVADDDPLVRTHAALLEPARPAEQSRDISFVEQATAAPGEHRRTPPRK